MLGDFFPPSVFGLQNCFNENMIENIALSRFRAFFRITKPFLRNRYSFPEGKECSYTSVITAYKAWAMWSSRVQKMYQS